MRTRGTSFHRASWSLIAVTTALGAVTVRATRADEMRGPPDQGGMKGPAEPAEPGMMPAKPEAAPAPVKAAPAKPVSPHAAEADGLAKAIDTHVNKRAAKEGLTPAPVADDAEFLRRVWIDIVGGAPDPSEVIAFLADQDPLKRKKKVDELLAKPEFARNWAEFWTDVMEGEATTKKREDQIKYLFRSWFEGQLKDDVPFDELTRRVIGAEGYVQENGAVGYPLAYTDMSQQPDPIALAATSARVFMGLQIECAQCHDHPFADWKRDEFMSLAAFFARAKRQQQKIDIPLSREEIMKLPEEERKKLVEEYKKKQQQAPFGVREADKGDFYAEIQTVRNPGEKIAAEKAAEEGKTTGKPASPAAKPAAPPAKGKPDKNAKGAPVPSKTIVPGKNGQPDKYLVTPAFIVPALAWKPEQEKGSLRQALGKLITNEKNPYFSRSCANRIWGRLTGRPLIAPSEDLSDSNAVNDLELLNLLGKGFRDLKHDHRAFVRAIVLTDAYQRSSRTTVNHDDRDAYAKLVHAEQLYAQGVVRPIDARPLARVMVRAMTLGATSLDDAAGERLQQGLLLRFERLFGESNMDPKKYEETIPQALFLINGNGTNRGGPLRAKGGGGKGGGREGPALTAPPSAAVGALLARYEDPRERVTRIYLAALCRPPRRNEIDDALVYVRDAGAQGDAYEDLLWALVNSAEFRFNR